MTTTTKRTTIHMADRSLTADPVSVRSSLNAGDAAASEAYAIMLVTNL